MKREKIKPKKVGSYFLEQKAVQYIQSGCTLLDCVLGGGWPLGRIANVVGDKSSGKTLLAIEACANFLRQFPDGRVYYLEAEAAFDRRFASALGMPVDNINFIEGVDTVEQMFHEVQEATKNRKHPGLLIVDSLDSLSDSSEMERDIDKGSFGAEKAKKLSQLFRRCVRRIDRSRLAIIIISQVRDKIGVTFGKKTTRSGGKALDFYASQVLELHEAGKIYRTINGVKRTTGVSVLAQVTKNKVGMPFRQCGFEILFGYGVDSMGSSLEFLSQVGELGRVDRHLSRAGLPKYRKQLNRLSDPEYKQKMRELDKIVKAVWNEIEQQFLPKRRKY